MADGAVLINDRRDIPRERRRRLSRRLVRGTQDRERAGDQRCFEPHAGSLRPGLRQVKIIRSESVHSILAYYLAVQSVLRIASATGAPRLKIRRRFWKKMAP